MCRLIVVGAGTFRSCPFGSVQRNLTPDQRHLGTGGLSFKASSTTSCLQALGQSLPLSLSSLVYILGPSPTYSVRCSHGQMK